MAVDEKRQIAIKQALGVKAASLITDGQIVGIGTGTTANFFIQSLSDRVKKGLRIQAVASSSASLKLASQGSIPLIDINSVEKIDLMVDGADEIDPKRRLIKGKGGAHLREKILAFCATKLLIIADESKLVDVLGKCGLPVEILPYGYNSTLQKLKERGFSGQLREKGAKPFVTDSGNFIFDIQSPSAFPDPEKNHLEIISIPGVIETGFFFNLATSLLIGYADGSVRLLE